MMSKAARTIRELALGHLSRQVTLSVNARIEITGILFTESLRNWGLLHG